MKLSPFMKQVEIEAGYKGFYRCGNAKITVTIEDSGIALYIDERTEFPASFGLVRRIYKPMASVWGGKKFMEQLGQPAVDDLDRLGFVEVMSIEV